MKSRSKTAAPAASLVVMFSQNDKFEQPLVGTVTVWNRVPLELFTPLRIAYAVPLCGNDPVLRVTCPLKVHGVVPVSNPGLTIVLVHPPPVPACDTPKFKPAIVIEPFRESEEVLAATE